MNCCFYDDLFAEAIGRALVDYFQSDGFPTRLLRVPVLNSLYLKTQLKKILDDTSLSDEKRYALVGAALDTYYEKGGNPLPYTERTFRHKFSVPGVEK